MKKRLLSLLTILAMVMSFAFTFMAVDDNVYASSSKKYYLPTTISVDKTDDSFYGVSEVKYDKYGNIKSEYSGHVIPDKYNISYRNSKGKLKKVTRIYDEEKTAISTYDKNGRISSIKVVVPGHKATYKYTKNKKGIITKVTRNGKLYYKVKNISYYSNGFVKKVTYSNGNVNYYNRDGLMTKAIVKTDKGAKYTYKYNKKNGKVVKAVEYRNGKKKATYTFEYGKKTTTSVWKYSCAMAWGGGPSNVYELYAKSAQSGRYSAWD